ncbi:MAG: ribosomal-processing cysteine protease Prp [Eubacteriales bacterium]|nr:ribosomal-processing cysteine protease Prp [Eubacteriales bacterium]
MVTVTMLRKSNRTVGFVSTGHAGFGEAGEDIVCSAISALTQTCCLGLVQVVGLKEGKDLVCSIDDAEGIHCSLADDTRGERLDRAELLFLTMEAGLCSIQESYRKSLKIRHREV